VYSDAGWLVNFEPITDGRQGLLSKYLKISVTPWVPQELYIKTLKVTNNTMMAGIDQHLWFFRVWKVGQDPWTTKASSMTYRFICRGCARPSSGEFARHVF